MTAPDAANDRKAATPSGHENPRGMVGAVPFSIAEPIADDVGASTVADVTLMRALFFVAK